MLMMSDKAYFHLDGYVNKQNCRFWVAENPQELHQRPLQTAKLSVWCGISKVGIAGPYFFEEEGATVIVTSERYVETLRNFCVHNFEVYGLTWKKCGSNKMEPQPTRQGLR